VASIGDRFPPEKRRAFIQQRLVPGCVIRIKIKFPEVTKHKFLVLVADDDPEIWTFIINSELNQYVKDRPHLLKCQVKIAAADHSFLPHDSYLACDKVLHLHRADVIRELMANMGGIRGNVDDDVMDQMRAAVKFAKTLAPAEKARILSSLVE